MEDNNFEETLNQLELINLKLDVASLETAKYIGDFEKIKEIIGEDENPENSEKESQSENEVKNDDNMEVDNSELDQINEDKEFKEFKKFENKEFIKRYKSHSNFTEESINNTSFNIKLNPRVKIPEDEPTIYIKPDPRIEITEDGDIKNIFDVEINLKKAIENLNNQESENNSKAEEE